MADVSFISLEKIISACVQFADVSESVFLIKPQFEAGHGEVEKGGIVHDLSVHKRVIMEVVKYGADNGFHLYGYVSRL